MNEFEKYVMSLDKFKNRKSVFVFQLDENGDYDNRDVYDLHHAWIASAQHEGYKLVPVEPTRELSNKLEDMASCQPSYDGMDIYKVAIGELDYDWKTGTKAMIGAAE